MSDGNCFIRVKNVSFCYRPVSKKILTGVNISVRRGEFLAIVGKNGAGKSTFLRLLNALLLPSEGDVFVDGCSTKEREKIYEIRSKVGMVLQNPENQIVNSIVEEDVAFGPENLGLSTSEIQERVNRALEIVGMLNHRNSLICELSGGQKQRVAIAGILAMKPRCLILDEITSMLDEKSKREILKIIVDLNKKNKITVIIVTHDAEEAIYSDRIIVFEDGQVKLETRPVDLFYDDKMLSKVNINKPNLVKFSVELKKQGIFFPTGLLFKDDFIQALEEKLCNT